MGRKLLRHSDDRMIAMEMQGYLQEHSSAEQVGQHSSLSPYFSTHPHLNNQICLIWDAMN